MLLSLRGTEAAEELETNGDDVRVEQAAAKVQISFISFQKVLEP